MHVYFLDQPTEFVIFCISKNMNKNKNKNKNIYLSSSGHTWL